MTRGRVVGAAVAVAVLLAAGVLALVTRHDARPGATGPSPAASPTAPAGAGNPASPGTGGANPGGGTGPGAGRPPGASGSNPTGSGGGKGAPGGPTPTPPADPDISYPAGGPDQLAPGGLYVVSLDGAPHHILGSQTLFDLPSWSDDGQRVLAMDRSTIFSVKPDGSDSRAIPGGATSTPAWSASGQMAYIVQNGSNYDLSVTQTRGSPKRISQGQVGPVSGRAWSPDGALLALVAGGRVWTARPDASGRTAITPAGGKAFRAVAFSPDGTTLAWYTSDGSVWVAGVDGSGAHRAGASGESFAWSPDNSHLVVSGADLTVLPAGAGAGAEASRSLGVGGSQVAWSPDGRRIAYVADTKIAVVNADGTGRVDLTDVPAGVALGRGLAWSPDGSHLLVNTGTAGRPGPAPPA